MAAAALTYEQFDTKGDPSSLWSRWKKWKRGFELYLVARGNTSAAQKRALLLHCGGLGLQDIFFTLTVADDAGYDVCLQALDTCFKPKANKTYERHVFQSLKPTDNEDNVCY